MSINKKPYSSCALLWTYMDALFILAGFGYTGWKIWMGFNKIWRLYDGCISCQSVHSLEACSTQPLFILRQTLASRQCARKKKLFQLSWDYFLKNISGPKIGNAIILACPFSKGKVQDKKASLLLTSFLHACRVQKKVLDLQFSGKTK